MYSCCTYLVLCYAESYYPTMPLCFAVLYMSFTPPLPTAPSHEFDLWNTSSWETRTSSCAVSRSKRLPVSTPKVNHLVPFILKCLYNPTEDQLYFLVPGFPSNLQTTAPLTDGVGCIFSCRDHRTGIYLVYSTCDCSPQKKYIAAQANALLHKRTSLTTGANSLLMCLNA